MFLMRYVDNRFLIFSDHLLKTKAMKLLCHPSVYRDPVTLEDVGDLHILGCLVDPETRHVSYIVPIEDWQFRTTKSAGSCRMNLGGLRSRVCIIRRQTFPKKLIQPLMRQLVQQYISRGFTAQQLNSQVKGLHLAMP